MPDAGLRDLERAARAGDPQAEARWFRARLRAGDADRILLAAYLGHPVARDVTDESSTIVSASDRHLQRVTMMRTVDYTAPEREREHSFTIGQWSTVDRLPLGNFLGGAILMARDLPPIPIPGLPCGAIGCEGTGRWRRPILRGPALEGEPPYDVPLVVCAPGEKATIAAQGYRVSSMGWATWHAGRLGDPELVDLGDCAGCAGTGQGTFSPTEALALRGATLIGQLLRPLLVPMTDGEAADSAPPELLALQEAAEAHVVTPTGESYTRLTEASHAAAEAAGRGTLSVGFAWLPAGGASLDGRGADPLPGRCPSSLRRPRSHRHHGQPAAGPRGHRLPAAPAMGPVGHLGMTPNTDPNTEARRPGGARGTWSDASAPQAHRAAVPSAFSTVTARLGGSCAGWLAPLHVRWLAP